MNKNFFKSRHSYLGSDIMAEEDVLERINSENVRWIKLQFLDVKGKTREVTVHASKISKQTFNNGLEIPEISNIFNDEENESLRLVPMAQSYGILPWEETGARMFCYIQKGKDLYQKDPMNILKKVLMQYENTGYSDITVETSQEFSVFETVVIDKSSPERGPSVNLDTREGPWNSNPMAYDDKWANITMPQDVYSLVRTQVLDTLHTFFNIVGKQSSHGKAVAKQIIGLDEMELIDSAISNLTMRYVAKNVSILNGATTTFMAYPMYMSEPNKIIFRIKIKKDGKNVFYNPDDENKISKTAKSFIAGIIENAPRMTVFTNPTTNSYRALGAFHMHNAWSVNLKNAIINVKETSTAEDCYVEVRIADSSANPVIALSAILSAGLAGIKKKSDPPKMLSENPDKMSEKDKKNYLGEPLPYSLYDAIISLEKDITYIKGIFYPEFLSDYLSAKLEEYKEDISRPSGFDYQRYYNI